MGQAERLCPRARWCLHALLRRKCSCCVQHVGVAMRLTCRLLTIPVLRSALREYICWITYQVRVLDPSTHLL